MFEDIINDNIEVFRSKEDTVIEINWTKKTVKVIPSPGATAKSIHDWFYEVHKQLGDRSPFKKIYKPKSSMAVVKTYENWTVVLDVKGTNLYIDLLMLNDIKIKECTFTNMEVTF